MKSFLETWLAELPAILHRELSTHATLEPAERLPSPATAISLAVLMDGRASGRFMVTVDRASLHSLFVEARLTEPEADSLRDDELWREFLLQAATVAGEAFGNVQIASIEDTQWSLGLPSAAYEIGLAEVRMRLAFTDQISVRAESPGSDFAPHAANPTTFSGEPRPGVDLLLDVELEASLRFGSCEISLNQVLELGPGDVVELDRHVADPVDLLVGDKIVAHGEVVLVNGSFGLRVTEVAEPRKCLESIRCLF
jgi:flagellar motor switch protein FliN